MTFGKRVIMKRERTNESVFFFSYNSIKEEEEVNAWRCILEIRGFRRGISPSAGATAWLTKRNSSYRNNHKYIDKHVEHVTLPCKIHVTYKRHNKKLDHEHQSDSLKEIISLICLFTINYQYCFLKLSEYFFFGQYVH